MLTVPSVDLAWQHAAIANEVELGFAEVIAESAFIGGEVIGRFESAFADYSGSRHAVAVGNGTDAIELGLRAHGIGSGDEVVLPANTFVATAEAVARSGATPVLVDCDDEWLLIDPAQVDDRMTARTRAVIGVHLYGQIAPLEQIEHVVGEHECVLLEDAAQAQGARRHGHGIGWFGTASTSFYPGKNLGAYGDGGAVLTNDDTIADLVRTIGNHGARRRYHHDLMGMNSRLDTLQAVVLLAKLARLDSWNELRRAAAERYGSLLSGLDGVRLPSTAEGNEHVWHLYTIRVEDRDRVLEVLTEAGIGAAIHYPIPVHLQPAFADLGHSRGDFPVSESAATRLLSLPIYPGLEPWQQERIAEVLETALAG